jgi:hypothetical protein
MSKNKTWFLVSGFLLFLYGFLAIILQFVGLQLSFLTWLDAGGNLLGFVLRLVMVIAGIVLAFWATLNTEQEEL